MKEYYMMNPIIRQAEEHQLLIIHTIVRTTIQAVYPRYYPKGAVKFFIEHHNEPSLILDIQGGFIWLLFVGEKPVATITISGNRIDRLFVLHEYQGEGYGKYLMDFGEKKIFEMYNSVELSASLSAQKMYQQRGYESVDFHKILCDNNDWLCYHRMKLIKKK